MLDITVKDIVKAVGGNLICGSGGQKIEHISIDSRSSQGNDIFVPIIGGKVDAHGFIGQALTAGCAATLTSRHQTEREIGDVIKEYPLAGQKAWIAVDDTVRALHEIGRLCRSRVPIPAVGVTGSVGKTTTREMIAAALSAERKVYKTGKNYNSSIGLPITLSEMSNDYDVAVLELGMNVPGELGTIADIADIDAAVLTNIGVAHIEYFKTQEAICREKYTITKGFHKDVVHTGHDGRTMGPEKMLFINGDDPYLMKNRDLTGYPYRMYGTGAQCDYRAEHIRMENGRYCFDFVYAHGRVPITLSVLGHHNVLNAAGALAVAEYFGVDVEAAAQALSSFTGFQNRLQICTVNGYTVIDDTYNASPASMEAGLKVLEGYDAPGRKIAVLGDMFELGENSDVYHREVGEFAAGLTFDELLLIGDHAWQIGRAMKEKNSSILVRRMESRAAATKYLKDTLGSGDVVYLKASNGMKLKEIAAALIQEK